MGRRTEESVYLWQAGPVQEADFWYFAKSVPSLGMAEVLWQYAQSMAAPFRSMPLWALTSFGLEKARALMKTDPMATTHIHFFI